MVVSSVLLRDMNNGGRLETVYTDGPPLHHCSVIKPKGILRIRTHQLLSGAEEHWAHWDESGLEQRSEG